MWAPDISSYYITLSRPELQQQEGAEEEEAGGVRLAELCPSFFSTSPPFFASRLVVEAQWYIMIRGMRPTGKSGKTAFQASLPEGRGGGIPDVSMLVYTNSESDLACCFHPLQSVTMDPPHSPPESSLVFQLKAKLPSSDAVKVEAKL